MTSSSIKPDAPPSQIADPFRRLVHIMARLRGPNGCPWDREQTHRTLTPYVIEEAYEVKESIDKNDFEELREELGDLMLQVVFHAQLAGEVGRFDIDDVLDTICDKLIRRHPHVFGDVEVSGSGEVLKNWEEIKKAEKRAKSERAASATSSPPSSLPNSSTPSTPPDPTEPAPPVVSILSGVPASLPALLKAHRIQEKVAHVGFDWASAEPIWEKIHEEIEELKQALGRSQGTESGGHGPARTGTDAATPTAGSSAAIAEEIGDLLFSIVNLARHLRIPAEEALDMTNRKFIARFRQIEERLHREGKPLTGHSLEYLDRLWEEAKERTDRRE